MLSLRCCRFHFFTAICFTLCILYFSFFIPLSSFSCGRFFAFPIDLFIFLSFFLYTSPFMSLVLRCMLYYFILICFLHCFLPPIPFSPSYFFFHKSICSFTFAPSFLPSCWNHIRVLKEVWNNSQKHYM